MGSWPESPASTGQKHNVPGSLLPVLGNRRSGVADCCLRSSGPQAPQQRKGIGRRRARLGGIHPERLFRIVLPAAFTIDWVVGLPISGKPNLILFTTGQYSVLDQLKYGLVMTTVGAILLIVAGFTWFRWLGITP